MLIHVFLTGTRALSSTDIESLKEQLNNITKPWRIRLEESLKERYPGQETGQIFQDYANAFEMYKRSYMTLKSDKHVDPKAYMADRLKMMAYTAFKCGDYIAMETYCGDLLRECGTLFGMGSLEHALAEVFRGNDDLLWSGSWLWYMGLYQ